MSVLKTFGTWNQVPSEKEKEKNEVSFEGLGIGG
jgi:hypothetical protein